MAVIHGKDGEMHIGTVGASSKVSRVMQFTIQKNTPLVTTSGMGDSEHSYVSGISETSFNATMRRDLDSGTNQSSITEGASIAVTLYPDGAGSGKEQYAGTVVIENWNTDVNHDGVPTLTISAKGPLPRTTQT